MIRIWNTNRYLACVCVSLLAMSPLKAKAGEPGAADTIGMDLPPTDEMESKVRSTLLFGGSSPVSFSGEGRLKILSHDYSKYPAFLARDQTWTQANWEGNESMIRLGMVVRANRNAVLWSKIGFQSTLPGIFVSSPRDSLGFTREQNRHDKSDVTANIHEDMAAGLAIRTVPASFWLRMGNILWTEASPLTIWKSQPRTFAWDYLPFEVEQPVSRYYEYNIAKGEKSGRAAWNKKAFNGVDFRSIDLPARLQVNLLWGAYERYDNFEREYLDFSGDLGLADIATDAKQIGIGDSFRHMYHARFAQEKFLGSNLTLGANGLGILYKRDIEAMDLWTKAFGITSRSFRDSVTLATHAYQVGEGFYKEPKVASIDLRGPVNEKLELHLDVAVSVMDTVWKRYAVDSSTLGAAGGKQYLGTSVRQKATADPAPAIYLRLLSRYALPVQADLAYIGRGFYSPFSFAAPVDAFFPYASNLVGGGKFIARGEGSPYTQNMAGMNLSFSPNVGYGHFRAAYGQHFQPHKARDVLFFPYRLNGQDLSSTTQSSYNRWGNDLVDHSMGGKYAFRLGDQSYRTAAHLQPFGPEAGGLRTDYLSAFEGFVPYENAAQADSNLNKSSTITTRTQFIPAHQKWTYNFELDGALDIGPALGYGHDLFISGYAAMNGVSSSIKAVSLSPKDMMLWGLYLRAEPAIALTDKFYLLGLVGYENWRSDMAYMERANTALNPPEIQVLATPIDYKDYAWGLGFDWDFASRVGLHGRYKQMWHKDVFYADNDWTNTLVSAEIKMWF